MKLKFLGCIVDAAGQEASADSGRGVHALAFSPNGRKLALATGEPYILLFDERGQQRDRFATKPSDPKYGKRGYMIRCLAFSPDSTRLAVGQSDNIVFVYRLGESWDEKKVICNKFPQSAAVSALLWPEESRLVIGLLDGKVRAGSAQSNKCATLYRLDAAVVALAHHPNRRAFVSGHEDGAIVIYSLDSRTQTKVCVHSIAPYCLALCASSILAAGADRRVVSYAADSGRVLQDFDFADEPTGSGDFYACVADPTGHSTLFGSFDRLRLLCWSERRGAWAEDAVLDLRNFHTVTALAWKPDGTTIVACSEVPWQWSGGERFYFDSDNVCLVINAGEITFVEYGANETLGWIRTERVNPHLVSVRVIGDPAGGGGVSSGSASARDSVASRRRVASARSASARSAGTARGAGGGGGVCRAAYLLDVHTIAVVNLHNNAQIAHITHQNAIDWIELNESAQKLLFRDVVSALYIHSLKGPTRTTRCLLGYCSYAQWVPRSDVVVAQSADQLCVWYNTDDGPDSGGGTDGNARQLPEPNAVRIRIQGDVEAVVRDEHRTEVIVAENDARVAYELDGTMIEFGTALDERDLSRALVFLERCERAQREHADAASGRDDGDEDATLTYELAPMWQRLADVALAGGALLIAQRCYASLNDFPKVRFLEETIERAELALQQQAARHTTRYQGDDAPVDVLLDGDHDAEVGGSGYASAEAIAAHYETRARVALLHKDFKLAERIYVEHGALDAAVEMYRRLGQWDAAVALASATGYARLDALKRDYFQMLSATGQMERAAELRVQEGDVRSALDIYLDSGRVAQAARLILEDASGALLGDVALVERVLDMLTRQEQFDRAAQLYEATGRYEQAIDGYRRARNFAKAVHVARYARPDAVVALEEQWADALVADGNFDAAANHYLESGQSLKAADAAIRAKEWARAVEILDAVQQQQPQDDTAEQVARHYAEIARHFEADGEYERAEKLYLESGRPADAVEMYNRAARWADAYKLAAEFFGADESRELYAQKAEALEHAGRLAEAEQLYVSVGEPTRAIAMYKAADRSDDVIRLVARYHPDRTQEMHKRLAEECEERGDLKTAEEHYLAARDWNSALEMYREAERFADAFRVAQTAVADGGADGEAAGRAISAVAYAWSKSLGGDAAVKLLTRHGLLHDAIDVGLIRGDFEFVFELCNLGAKTRFAEAHQKFAEHLEDEGDFSRAEEFYLKAGKGREAVLMHVHNQNWEAAERLAAALQSSEGGSADVLADVLVARGHAALDAHRPADAEDYFLRAARADLIIAHYRETGAWADALRVAAKYAPDALAQLQHDYESAEAARGGAASAQIFIAQAADWERQGDYQRAVDCYLKVDARSADSADAVVYAQTKAAELIAKFLAADEGLTRVREIGERLDADGHHTPAAEVFLLARLPERAVDALVQAQEWARARRIAADTSPAAADAVERAYRDYLRAQGRVGELADVDASAAIDLLAERGDWEAALAAASQQNSRQLLDKYLLAHAGQLADAGRYDDAARLFLRYGASTTPAALNLYKFIIDASVNVRGCDYGTYSTLRDVLADLNGKITADDVDPRIIQIFERYEFALHLYALREALAPLGRPTPDADGDASEARTVARLRLQQSVALLRYVDLLQPDKVFFEAGDACRSYGKEYENLGFVLLNHCLDVADAIEERDATLVDNSIFDGTDIPQNYAIPDAIYITPTELEEVKDWVLATSVGRNVAKQLKLDARGVFEASTLDADGNSQPRTVCAISGYPILDASRVKELTRNRVADLSAWSAFLRFTRGGHASDQLFDVHEYLTK